MDSEVYSQSTCIAIRAAQLYYIEHSSQRNIADEMGISVPTVSRLINRARNEGLVQFSISEPYAACLDLENSVKAAFGLADVLVAPSATGDREATTRAVALEAARLVQRLTTPDDILGIAWGGTMSHLIGFLNPCRRVPAGFVTLHGSISSCGPELNPATLVERMAMAFGGRRHRIDHAGLAESRAGRDVLLAEPETARVSALYDRITIAVSGVGSLYPEPDSRLVRSHFLTEAEVAEVRAAGAYGDMVLRFFDESGQECRTSLSERTLGISLDQYRDIPRKIVAASGAHKAQTVRAMLRGRLADVLVVDEELARGVLALA
ncbi:sugar-binding transcriptional regulator [Propionicicella superfundia]|uniref:sugar-binding transcriptional regulator n=1 Tax=Propionicicella superfundia TaxID=348582 RepID=UPI0003F4DE6D|nr:sugar-binding domain-containing protein [Propionicicella superfundia]